MRTNTILLLASCALAPSMHASAQNSPKGTPQAPPAAKSAAKPAAKTGGDDFFVGLGQTDRAPRDAAAFRRLLAHAQLTLEVDGKPEAARAELEIVRNQLAAAPEFEERREVLLEAIDLSTRILLQLGDHAGALELFDPRVGSERWKSAISGITTDPRFLAILTRIGSSANNTPDAQQIRHVVVEAIQKGNYGLVTELGTAAVPALEELVRAEPSGLAELGGDPFYLLVQCAPQRAAALARELLAAPTAGFLVAKRVVRAMNASPSKIFGPESGAWGWEARNAWLDNPPILVATDWRAVVTALLGIPAVAGDAVPYVKQFVELDALDEPMRRALSKLARTDEPGTSALLARVLENAAMRTTVRPLLEDLLEAPAAELRVVVANQLVVDSRNAALLARVEDPEWRVRAAVAAALQERKVKRAKYQSPAGSYLHGEETLIEFDHADRPILDRLLADPVPEVRAIALRIASKEGIALDPAGAARALDAQDATVRSLAVRCLPEDPDVAAPLLERALQDGVADVRANAADELIQRLEVVSRTNDPSFRFPDGPMPPALRDLALRQWMAGMPEILNSGLRWKIVERSVRTPADARALVQALLKKPELPSLPAWRLAAEFGSNDRHPVGYWVNLDAELIERLLRRALDEKASVGNYQVVVHGVFEGERPDHVRNGVAAIVRDPTVQRSYRRLFLLALRESPHAGALLTDLLTNPVWGPDEDGQEFVNTSRSTRLQLPPEAVIAALPALVSGQVPARVVESQIKSLIAQRRMPDEYAAPLIARFAAEPFALEESLDWAIRREAALGHWDSVRPMLDANFLSTAAIGAVGRGRPPEGLSWLAAILDDPNQASSKGTLAATAIAGYLSEEAAEILLRGAQSAPTPEVRKACLDGVAEIRAFLDQKASWQQRESGRLQRDTAVAELVRMLDSTDAQQRAQAARGLGTLEAAETIPRLIRLLKDAHAGVQKAAQEALDRLNR